MKQSFRSVKGTSDFYPPQTAVIETIYQTAKELFSRYGYEPILLPHLEEEGLFTRSVGVTSDIVEKQIFKIETKEIVLRPEGTAQVARFYIQNSLHKQKDFHKFYYIGSMFRGERPQKGRLREFHHIGAEAIGSDSPYLDAELIILSSSIIAACGIGDFAVRINSLGCARDKQSLAQAIKAGLSRREAQLCDDCKRRFKVNPLRIIDCKRPSCKSVVDTLGISDEHLCNSCREHFSAVREVLDGYGLSYEYQPLLVRGLDYYTNTVFELCTAKLGAQDAIGAGGRYNKLIASLGGTDIPAVGFALGLERMLLLRKQPASASAVSVYIVTTSPRVYGKGHAVCNQLRNNGISCDIDYKRKSLKAQLKSARRLGATWTVLIGDEELKEGCIIIRDMRKSTQEKIKIDSLLPALKKKISQK